MLVKYHIFLGFILSLILFLILPNIGLIGAGVIFLSSFLIDFDHYAYYVLKKKDTSLRRALKYFFANRKKLISMKVKERKKFYSGFFFLHGIESLIILFIAGIFISKYFLLIFIGFTFHIFLDIIEETYNNFRMDKISTIYDWFKFKKLKILE